MKEQQPTIDSAFKMIEKMEEKFENMKVHSLLMVVGESLHDTVDYGSLFNSFNNYMQFKDLYFNARSSSLKEDLENETESEDKIKNKLYSQMIFHRQEIEKAQMINAQQILSLQDMARRALEVAVKKSKTKAELLQCAKYIEFEIYDKDWADEIRKQAYGESWNPSNYDSTDRNQFEQPISDFDTFMKENEADLMKYFSTKSPAGL